MTRLFFAASVTLLLAILNTGCKQTKPARIYFDVSSTRLTMAAACANLGTACIGVGKSEILDYENRLRTSFASDAQCKGIGLVGSSTTYLDKETLSKDADWRLEINWLPPLGGGDIGSRLGWSLEDSKNHQYASDSVEVKQLHPASDIRSVCNIVKNRGGEVR